MKITHVISLVACALIVCGLVNRSRRERHRACMWSAFVLDLGLVLWIELTRGAVETALAMGNRPIPGPMLSFHIAVSVMTLVLYVVQLVSGTRLFGGRELSRNAHRRAGWTFVALRATNLVTSFLI